MRQKCFNHEDSHVFACGWGLQLSTGSCAKILRKTQQVGASLFPHRRWRECEDILATHNFEVLQVSMINRGRVRHGWEWIWLFLEIEEREMLMKFFTYYTSVMAHLKQGQLIRNNDFCDVANRKKSQAAQVRIQSDNEPKPYIVRPCRSRERQMSCALVLPHIWSLLSHRYRSIVKRRTARTIHRKSDCSMTINPNCRCGLKLME